MLLVVCAVITVSVASFTIRVGRRRVFTVLPVSTWPSGRSSAAVGEDTSELPVNISTDVLHRPVRTALRAPTHQLRAVTSAIVRQDMSDRRVTSTILAARVVPVPSVSLMVVCVLRRPAQDGRSCTSALAGLDSTDQTAPSSTHARRRRVSTVPPASTCLGSCTRADARRDTTVGSVTGGHLAKVVRVRMAPRASRPEARSAAHVQPDTTAILVTKVTPVS